MLLEAKKIENSEIVLGRSLIGYDSTFTHSHIHRKKNTEVHTELILTDTRDWFLADEAAYIDQATLNFILE